jgi:DHA2 family multidrug resistance protein-like MFS transporter
MSFPATPASATRRTWLGLFVLLMPCLLISIDLTALNLAVPTLTADLDPTANQTLWIVDIYGFMVAGSLITIGALGDRIGRRKLLMIGAAGFALTSLLAAFASTPEMLIVARGLLGIAGATLMPSTVALIRSLFEREDQRSLAIGIWSATFAVGWAIGPLVGGLLIERFWWGAVFLLALPVAALLLIMGPRLLPETRSPLATGLDLPSSALSIAAILAIVFGIKTVADRGLEMNAVVALGLGTLLGTVFIVRQLRVVDPMIDFGLFRSRQFSTAMATTFLATALSVATLFLVAQYVQLVLGYTPIQAGLLTLPIAIASFFSCIGAPLLARRVRVEYIFMAGLLAAAAALTVMIGIGQHSGTRCIAAAVLLTLGLGPVATLATDYIIRNAPTEQLSRVSACNETAFELGGAMGIALFGSAAVAMYRSRLDGAIPGGLSSIDQRLAHETLPGALSVAHTLPTGVGDSFIESARVAFVSGIQVTSVIGVVVAILAAGIVGLSMKSDVRATARSPLSTNSII